MENKNSKLEISFIKDKEDVRAGLEYSQNQTSYFSVKKEESFSFKNSDKKSKDLIKQNLLSFIKSINHELNIDLNQLSFDKAYLDVNSLSKESSGIETYIDFLNHIPVENVSRQSIYFYFRDKELYFTWSKTLNDGNKNELRFDFINSTSNTKLFLALLYFVNLL